jgi:hypothetical protein
MKIRRVQLLVILVVVFGAARGRDHVGRKVVPDGGHHAQVDWYIEGVEFSNCNCDYACPCQFESRRPTNGDCRGFAAVRIDKGYFRDVALDGLGAALLYAWPGPIYEGNGECQAVIDERADGKQRDALATVLYGGETNEGATHWWVYRMMSRTVHPPLSKRIEFDVDIERRKGAHRDPRRARVHGPSDPKPFDGG